MSNILEDTNNIMNMALTHEEKVMSEANKLLMMFIKDGCSASGKVSKKTALAMMKFVSCDHKLQSYVNNSDWVSALRHNRGGWISVDAWDRVDCKPVWVWYSHLTDLGMVTGCDKAYWNDDSNCWSGFGLDNVFSDGAIVRYVQHLPAAPNEIPS